MAFITDAIVQLRPPETTALTGSDFGVLATIDGQQLRFEFSWNGSHFYYSLDILRVGEGRVRKLYLAVDDLALIRNFNPRSSRRPDAMVALIDVTGKAAHPFPFRIGTTHILLLLLGRYRKL